MLQPYVANYGMDVLVRHQLLCQLRTPEEELTDAEKFWVKSTQLVEFSHSISTLKAGKEIATNSKIMKLQHSLSNVVSSELVTH